MTLGKTATEKRTRDRIGMSGRPGQESDRGVGAIKSIDKAMGILRELYTASRPMSFTPRDESAFRSMLRRTA